MVAQEYRPLTVVGNLRRLTHDVGDGKPVFARQRHVHARHQREMKRHMAFVALPEILLGILRPLVGLSQQHATRIGSIDHRTNAFQNVVRLRKVLIVGALPLHEIGHGVEP